MGGALPAATHRFWRCEGGIDKYGWHDKEKNAGR